MLLALHIQNVVLIDRLSIEFKDGLCALTGETGAGKSILLDSLGLALGARAESRLVRKGADQAQVTAEFSIDKNPAAVRILENAGIEADELLLRRVLNSDGKSRAFINDQPVSASLLRDLGETLIEIHGQFETHGLLNPATHRNLLDEYAAITTDISAFWCAWKEAELKLQNSKSSAENLRAEEEYLRQSLQDLDALGPQLGEEETLKSLRMQLMNREQVLEGLNAAYQILNDENDPVRAAWAALDRIAGKMGDSANQAIAALDRASTEIEEAVALISDLSNDLEQQEHNLESIDDRLHSLRAQARKHGCAPDELPAKREQLAEQLNLIEHGDDVLAAQMKMVDNASKAYIKEAEIISQIRKKSAKKLSDLVQRELPPLKLEKASFICEVSALDESDWGPAGMDEVRFLVSTNPGSNPGPLNKIASGGEMARFMLALKVVMAATGTAGTMIFDEVDAGVGGAVADAVGERLAKLAASKQVLVVTHAPQIAARATHHWIVSKEGAKEAKTNVLHLDAADKRREEIARMLSGAKVTDEARAAAQKLMETGA